MRNRIAPLQRALRKRATDVELELLDNDVLRDLEGTLVYDLKAARMVALRITEKDTGLRGIVPYPRELLTDVRGQAESAGAVCELLFEALEAARELAP